MVSPAGLRHGRIHRYPSHMSYSTRWRGDFTNAEVASLHAVAFGAPHHGDVLRDWRAMTERHSLGWVTAREVEDLVGFVNVVTDGGVHAWVQDTMVAPRARHRGLGTEMMAVLRAQASARGCEWLHVDFASELSDFYWRASGFEPTAAGLLRLTPPPR